MLPSVCCLSVCLSVQNAKKHRFMTGIKIWVSMWSPLYIAHPLQKPIPMCKKIIRVQQENL
jgi:hypothetical protein